MQLESHDLKECFKEPQQHDECLAAKLAQVMHVI